LIYLIVPLRREAPSDFPKKFLEEFVVQEKELAEYSYECQMGVDSDGAFIFGVHID